MQANEKRKVAKEKREQIKLLEVRYEEAQGLDGHGKIEPIKRELAWLRMSMKDPLCQTCKGKGYLRIESYVGFIKDIVTCANCFGTGRVDGKRKLPRRKK